VRAPPKVHKRHRLYNKAVCGNLSAYLTDVNAEVTCKSCRGWLPVGEREVPRG
jgi:tetrahydromethanopterin S-methyltransferase subunit E